MEWSGQAYGKNELVGLRELVVGGAERLELLEGLGRAGENLYNSDPREVTNSRRGIEVY